MSPLVMARARLAEIQVKLRGVVWGMTPRRKRQLHAEEHRVKRLIERLEEAVAEKIRGEVQRDAVDHRRRSE